tara:strand:+ start:880 stop:1068 length:189 start_codon:yes stop_codon:yes gene_type:complete
MSYIIVQIPINLDLEETTPLVADDGDTIEKFDTQMEAELFMDDVLKPFFGDQLHDLHVLRIH